MHDDESATAAVMSICVADLLPVLERALGEGTRKGKEKMSDEEGATSITWHWFGSHMCVYTCSRRSSVVCALRE